MQPKDVEVRLQTVLAQLEAGRQAAKQALDNAWATEPETVAPLLKALQESHSRYTEFSEVSRKALPLLQALGQIDTLRQDAVLHLERLTSQADESRRLKAELAPSDIETMSQVPQSVGENFDLGLLADEQLEQIRAAHKVLSFGRDATDAAPPSASGSEPEANDGPEHTSTVDVTLEEWTETVQSLTDKQDKGAQPDPVGLPGDDALDAMFEEAVTAEAAASVASPPAPEQEPVPEPGPEAAPEPAPAAEDVPVLGMPESLPDFVPDPPAPEPTAPVAPARDPLDELLTRAGFEG